jgi:hypothetical protein
MHRSKPQPSPIEVRTPESVTLWFALGLPLITFCCWLLGLLLLHPWAGFLIGLAFGVLGRDYIVRKNLWSLTLFGFWIAGVVMNHAWLGFFAGLALWLGISAFQLRVPRNV